MRFKVIVEKRALNDLSNAFEYYNEQKSGLGKTFIKAANLCFAELSKNPFYQVRYDSVRCVPLSKFPFMVHFKADEKSKTVQVFAVIHTSLNPETKWLI